MLPRAAFLLLLTVRVESADPRGQNSRLMLCSRKWVKMNDRNYQKALEHYADCAALGHNLNEKAKSRYQGDIMLNIQKTCNYFFKRSELPISSLIGVLKEVARILEGLDENTLSQPKGQWKDPSVSEDRLKCLATVCVSLETSTFADFPRTSSDQSRSRDGNKGPSCLQRKLALLAKEMSTKTVLWGLFWLIVFTVIVQLLFILWLFCISACMGISAFGRSPSHSKEKVRKDGVQMIPYEIRHMNSENYNKNPFMHRCQGNQQALSESHAELSSLSSENIGSDMELEVLLSQKKLTKSTRTCSDSKIENR